MPGESSATYDLLLHENELVNPLSQSPATARRLINFIPGRAAELSRKPYAPPFTSENPPNAYWFSFVRDYLFYVAGTPARQIIIGVSNNLATFLYKWATGGELIALPNAAYSPPHNPTAGWVGDPLILYSDGLLYISDGHANDKGTVYDGTNTWKWGLEVPAVPVLFSLTAAGGIGTPSFAGAGLNDLTTGGTFTGGANATFEIEITATGTPDTFRWRVNGGAWNSGVLITGEAQALSRGLTITFASTTGHTATDTWTIVCGGIYIEEFVEYALTEYDTTYKRESAPGTRLRVAPEQAGYYNVHLSLPARVNKAPGTAADWTAGYANKFRIYRSHIDGSTQLFRHSEVNATDSAQSDAVNDTVAFYGDETSTLLPIEPPFRNQKPKPSKVGVKFHGRFALRDETRRSRLWITGLHEILAQQSFSPPLETVPGTTNQTLVESGDERRMFNLSDYENFVELTNQQFEVRALLSDRDAVVIGTELDVVAMSGRRPEDPFEVSNVATYEFGVFHKNAFLRTSHGLVIFTADRRLVLDPAFGAGGDRTSQVEDIGWPKQLELDKTDIQYSNRFQMVHYKFGQDIDQLWIAYTTQNAIDGGRAHLICYDFQVRGWFSVDDILATCVGVVREDQGHQFLVAGHSVAGGTGSGGVSAAVFVGAGLNDLTSGGTYTGAASSSFEVKIQGTGSPNTFQWRKGTGAWTQNISITGGAQALSDGVTVTFAATTGHTIGDKWTIAATPAEDRRLKVVLGFQPSIDVTSFSGAGLNDLSADGNFGNEIPPSTWSFDVEINGTVTAVPVAAFFGNGLNDLTSGGTYSGTIGAVFEIEIDGTGTPDTFKWRKNSGSYTTGVAITGAAQALSDGVTVTFAATTGHTLADRWTITLADRFRWRVNGGAFTGDVTITGEPQELAGGVFITFGAVTGHTLGNAWVISATPNNYAIAADRLGLPVPGTQTRPANTWITSLLDLQKPESWKVWQWLSLYKRTTTPTVTVKFYSDPQDIDLLDQGTVAPAVFHGNGLNDATSGGTYSGSTKAVFVVEILTAATPDTFRWRKDGGNWSAPVAITGAAQTLSDSVTITFAATTGHTVGDFWVIDTPNMPAETLVFNQLTSREFQGWLHNHQQCKRAVFKFTIAAGGAAGALRGIKVNVTPGGELDRL